MDGWKDGGDQHRWKYHDGSIEKAASSDLIHKMPIHFQTGQKEREYD